MPPRGSTGPGWRTINEELGGHSESYRRLAVATVRGFYEKNDSPLFGRVTIAAQPGKAPPKALKADDIRKVLRPMISAASR